MNTNHFAQKKITVLIVGCGYIAGGLDIVASYKSNPPLTHAGAYLNDGRFYIKGCVEPNEKKRLEFMKFWNIPNGYNDINEIKYENEHFDIISVCTPTNSHFNILIDILKFSPKLVFAEKPLTNSIHKSNIILDEFNKANIKLAVNHSRRWNKEIIQLKSDIANKKWGKLRTINGIYNKGILNNGTHVIDFLYMLMDEMKFISSGIPIHDFFDQDPSIPFNLEGKGEIPIQISCANANDYTIFEFQFVFSNCIIYMENGGEFWRERKVENSQIYLGYKVLSSGYIRNGNASDTYINIMNNLYDCIIINSSINSSSKSAVLTQTLCDEIVNHATMN